MAIKAAKVKASPWGYRIKGDMAGKPCTPGHTVERDHCTKVDGEGGREPNKTETPKTNGNEIKYRGDKQETESAIKDLFGDGGGEAVVAALGIPGKSKVTIRGLAGQLYIRADNSELGFETGFRIVTDKAGKKYVHLDEFFIDDREKRGKGTGTTLFGKMCQNLSKVGFDRIEMAAIREPLKPFSKEKSNGYYTWARLGGDGDLSDTIKYMLPANLKGATRVSELMKTQEGREWWKEKGRSIGLDFDLTVDSLSMKVLTAYLEAKGKT